MRYYLIHGLTSWFVLFSIILCLNSNFLFRNFLSIPSNTKIKWLFGANSRKENKFLNQYQSVYFLMPIELSNFSSDIKIIKKQTHPPEPSIHFFGSRSWTIFKNVEDINFRGYQILNIWGKRDIENKNEENDLWKREKAPWFLFCFPFFVIYSF